MKRIRENIKTESTEYDEEECAIKAEYCKGWNEKTMQNNFWLSPRQSKERKHMTVAESLALSFELKQQKTVNVRDDWNPQDPHRELQDLTQLKHQGGYSINKSSIIIKEQESENARINVIVKKEAQSETKSALVEAKQLELSIPVSEAITSETKPKQILKKKQSGKSSPKKETRKYVMETDPEIIRRRQKQIDYGKNTEGYRSYLQTVAKKERSLGDPRTPPLKQKFSRRHWDSMVRTWRLQLHEWDPPAADILSLDRDDESSSSSSPQNQVKTALETEDGLDSQENEQASLEKAYKQVTHRIKVQRAMMLRLRQRLNESSPSKVSKGQTCVDQDTDAPLKDQEKTEDCQTASAGSDW